VSLASMNMAGLFGHSHRSTEGSASTHANRLRFNLR